MVHRSSPAPFLLKTYQLVDEASTDEVISWNDSGTGFVVWKTADFAKDLLPNSFKHNNFSSFIRQLNTYGFHKTVPDKWEFANQYFKRGRKELLIEIHRRKAVAPPKGDGLGLTSPHSSSGDDHGSISTSSRDDSKNHGLENLFEENEKLKKEKECLKMEIAQAKKQCDDLMVFLSECVHLAPEQIRRIRNGDMVQEPDANDDDDNKDDDCFRLFGVLLKAGKKKRGRDVNNNVTSGVQMKYMKLQGDFNNDIPWMNRSCSVTEHYK